MIIIVTIRTLHVVYTNKLEFIEFRAVVLVIGRFGFRLHNRCCVAALNYTSRSSWFAYEAIYSGKAIAFRGSYPE